MRKTFCLKILIVSILGFVLGHSLFSFSVTNDKITSDISFYISPKGSDSYCGTSLDMPFATLFKARDVIRALKSKNELNGPVNVYLLAGFYELSESFILTPEDSGTSACPISYRAFENGQVIITGSKIKNIAEQDMLSATPSFFLQGDRNNKEYVQYLNFHGLIFSGIPKGIPTIDLNEKKEKSCSSVIIFNATKFCSFENNWIRNVEANYGISLGEGTSNTLLRNNIFDRVISGVFCAGLNHDITIENNFFIHLKDHVLCVNNPEGQSKNSVSFVRNIVYGKYSDLCIYRIDKAISLPSESDFNLYWNPYECFTHMTFVMLSEAMDAEYFEGREGFFAWQKLGFDKNSIVWNPSFVNVSKGDYTLTNKSPAFMIDIKNIDIINGGLGANTIILNERRE